MGMKPTTPIITLLGTITSKRVTLERLQAERSLNVKDLKSAAAALCQILRDILNAAYKRACNSNFRGELSSFAKGDFVRMSRDEFIAGEKLSLRWQGPRGVVKSL